MKKGQRPRQHLRRLPSSNSRNTINRGVKFKSHAGAKRMDAMKNRTFTYFRNQDNTISIAQSPSGWVVERNFKVVSIHTTKGNAEIQANKLKQKVENEEQFKQLNTR